MKKKLMWVGLVVIVLAGLYALYVESFGSPELMRASAAESAVKASLFDGDSAKFRGVHAVNIITICGEVNAKNRFGAFTGYTEFSVTGEDETAIVALDKESTDILCH